MINILTWSSSLIIIPVPQPEKNTKVAVMHHKCHSYLPGSPRSERLLEHRNSTPAIHLKMESSTIVSESLTSLSPRTRHGTWSHCQHQGRDRTTSVTRSTQTNSDCGPEELTG